MVIINEKHIYLFHAFLKKKKKKIPEIHWLTYYTYLTTCLFEEKKIHLEIQ